MPQLYHARYKLEDQTDKTDTKIYLCVLTGDIKGCIIQITDTKICLLEQQTGRRKDYE